MIAQVHRSTFGRRGTHMRLTERQRMSVGTGWDRGEHRWRFPDNQHGEIKGFNDAGVSTFGADTISSVVRETIQNSLDAALDRTGTTPVRVEFDEFAMGGESIPGSNRLYQALKGCMKSCQGDRRASKFFEEALYRINGRVSVLRISDHGTTGLRGAASGEMSTDWSRLVKESGSSSKDDLSGGSFGIGKYAVYACSGMRCVFYSSLDDEGVLSSIGAARLVSFEDGNGHMTTGIGYYSDNDRNVAMLEPLDFPGAVAREPGDTGTDLYVIDFIGPDDTLGIILREVLENFLVSIWKGRLEVEIGGQEINKHNLGMYVGELNPKDKKDRVIIEYFDMLRPGAEGVSRIVLDPARHAYARKWHYQKGEAVLYLKQGDGLNRRVMMTRLQGMRLFDQDHISGSINFTGILCIQGHRMNEDFREMEAPSHDKWDPGRSSMPKRATQRYKELRDWIRDMVAAEFQRSDVDKVDAFNAGLYLPKDQRVQATLKKRGVKRSDPDSEKKKVHTRKKKVAPKERGGAHAPGGVGTGPGQAGTRKGQSAGKRGGKRGGVEPGTRDGLTFVPVRSRAMRAENLANTYRVKLVVPDDVSRCMLEVRCDGERGQSDLTLRSARVVRGDIEEKGVKKNAISLGTCRKGEVIEVEYTPDFDKPCMMEVNFYAAK